MSSTLDEPIATLVCPDTATTAETEAWLTNHQAIILANQDATATSSDDLDAFLDLLMAVDTGYIETPEYEMPQPAMPLDWESVSNALSESQQILIGVQHLLAETLAGIGVENAEYIRVYANDDGSLHLTSAHPRQEEIENILNSPANAELRNLYRSAVTGMSLAGGLVGTMALPPELLAKIASDHSAA